MIQYLDMTPVALILGFALDLVFGDPRAIPHPVVLMGKAIAAYERTVRPLFPQTPHGQFVCGAVLAFGLPLMAFAVTWAVIWACGLLAWWFGLIVQTWICYQLFATCELRRQSMHVMHELRNEGLEAARNAVSMIVGRDTAALDRAGVTRAAVETVAENASDGVVAPMVFMAVGGPALGMFYKAINTMDSMIGYRNDKYLYFGRCAARLDDIANWIPSRFCALCMITCARLVGLSTTGAWRIWRRDRHHHASPNAGQTEAAMAGALGVRLGGDASYFGKLIHKPTLGDDLRPIEDEDIARANRLMISSVVLALIVCALVRIACLAAIA